MRSDFSLKHQILHIIIIAEEIVGVRCVLGVCGGGCRKTCPFPCLPSLFWKGSEPSEGKHGTDGNDKIATTLVATKTNKLGGRRSFTIRFLS